MKPKSFGDNYGQSGGGGPMRVQGGGSGPNSSGPYNSGGPNNSNRRY